MRQTLLSLTSSLVLLAFCSSLLAQAPANDDCENALALDALGTYEFSTLEATTGGSSHPDNCTSAGSTPDSIYNDIWFTYTADFSGKVLFSTCGTADFDTKIFVYAASTNCPPQEDDVISCNEDGPGCANSTSSAVFDVVNGETYLLRLGGWGNGGPGEKGSGTFSLVRYVPPTGPVNDVCETAIELTLDEATTSITVEFSSIGAGTDGLRHIRQSCFDRGEEYVYNDIWYKYVATFTGYMEWSNCGTSNFDSRMAVYVPESGTCDLVTSDLIGCSDDGIDENNFNCPGYTSRAIFPVEEGKTYFLTLGGFSPSGAGTGTFILKRINPPVPPANDNCADAESVFIITAEQADNFDEIFEGYNFNGSSEEFPSPTCQMSGEFFDVWYRFNSGYNTEIGFRINLETNGSEFIFDLFDDCGVPTTDASAYCFRTEDQEDRYLSLVLDGFPGQPREYLLRISTQTTFFPPGQFWFQLVGEPYVVSGVQELDIQDFKFFPNPVHEKATVQFTLKEAMQTQVELVNMLGQVVRVQQYNLTAGQQNLDISTANLDSGIYFLRLHSGQGQKAVKFVKQ